MYAVLLRSLIILLEQDLKKTHDLAASRLEREAKRRGTKADLLLVWTIELRDRRCHRHCDWIHQSSALCVRTTSDWAQTAAGPHLAGSRRHPRLDREQLM
jgi:hypothetical protein